MSSKAVAVARCAESAWVCFLAALVGVSLSRLLILIGDGGPDRSFGLAKTALTVLDWGVRGERFVLVIVGWEGEGVPVQVEWQGWERVRGSGVDVVRGIGMGNAVVIGLGIELVHMTA